MENHNLVNECHRLNARVATRQELALVHKSSYLDEMETRAKMRQSDLNKLSGEFEKNSIFMCTSTQSSALLAAGSSLQIVENIIKGESRSGLAVRYRFKKLISIFKSFGHESFVYFNRLSDLLDTTQLTTKHLGSASTTM